jgi:hypothetical protein
MNTDETQIEDGLFLDKVLARAQSAAMKPRVAPRPTAALTLVEVMVVLALLVLGVAFYLPYLSKYGIHSQRLTCVINLKQIGLSYRIWSGDNLDKFPFELSVTNGGTKELNFGRNAWVNFLVMSNELSTKHLPPATNFSSQLVGHISYFVGVDASESNPQGLLAGDDNFEVGGVPVKSGLLIMVSNTQLAWSAARHHFAGNVALADGSVQSLSNSGLTNWLRQTGFATNHLVIP